MPDWNESKGIEVPYATPTGDAGIKLNENFDRLRNEAPYNATDDPGNDDDEDIGFFPGSLWFNTTSQVLFACVDATAGNAVWRSVYQRTASALILCPGSGSGECGLQLDSGGDARGVDAVDLQSSRTSSSQVASGDRSFIAGGKCNTASGNYSHAEGYYTAATGDCSHAEGQFTTASGIAAHAEGQYTTASGLYAHAEGRYTTALGSASHAQGYSQSSANGITASGAGSDAGGWTDDFGSITASGAGSHAEGYANGTSGNVANITASSAGAHAEGFSSGAETIMASGKGSHAEGRKTTASEDYAHAEGWETTANAKAAHAEGRGTTASGTYSHAQGRSSTASGAYSHAAGHESVASFVAQHALAGGKFGEVGDAQFTRFIMRGETDDDSWTELITPEEFDGLTENKSYGSTITIHGRQDTGEHHAIFMKALIVENTDGTVSIAGDDEIAYIKTDSTWDYRFADTGNDGLKIEVKGGDDQYVRWVAVIETVEIKYAN